jgi:uncharacterized membrane protein
MGGGPALLRYFRLLAGLHGISLDAWILTALACVELVADQLPSTPSRKVPVQFGTRILMGALSGGTLGSAGGLVTTGIVLGILGAVIGTLGGAKARQIMAQKFGADRPAAIVEDAVAIALAILVVCALRTIEIEEPREIHDAPL